MNRTLIPLLGFLLMATSGLLYDARAGEGALSLEAAVAFAGPLDIASVTAAVETPAEGSSASEIPAAMGMLGIGLSGMIALRRHLRKFFF